MTNDTKLAGLADWLRRHSNLSYHNQEVRGKLLAWASALEAGPAAPADVSPKVMRVRVVNGDYRGQWRYFDFDPSLDLNRPGEEVEVFCACTTPAAAPADQGRAAPGAQPQPEAVPRHDDSGSRTVHGITINRDSDGSFQVTMPERWFCASPERDAEENLEGEVRLVLERLWRAASPIPPTTAPTRHKLIGCTAGTDEECTVGRCGEICPARAAPVEPVPGVGASAWASRAFDPDEGDAGEWGEWIVTAYEPTRQPDRWFQVVPLPRDPQPAIPDLPQQGNGRQNEPMDPLRARMLADISRPISEEEEVYVNGHCVHCGQPWAGTV